MGEHEVIQQKKKEILAVARAHGLVGRSRYAADKP